MIQNNFLLKNYSNFKIGGNAKYFLEIKSTEDLIHGLKLWKKISEKLPKDEQKVFILGGGTNLLVSDNGFDGLVIHNNIKFIEEKDGLVLVGAGVLIKDLLGFCIKNSWSGLEWAGGLPGTVGGAIRGNAGAFAGEIKDNTEEVISLDFQNLRTKKRRNKQCYFGYRTSVFKNQGELQRQGLERPHHLLTRSDLVKRSDLVNDREIILAGAFKLIKGEKKKIEVEIEEKKSYRKNRHPLDYPNIGSIFKNIPLQNIPQKIAEEFKNSIKNDPFQVLPVAKLIAFSNLKGERVGDAQVSEKHPNFIINLGNAKSEDVKKLIMKVKKAVKEKFAVTLEEEITI